MTFDPAAEFHIVRREGRSQLFVVDGSRLYDIDDVNARRIEVDGDAQSIASAFGLEGSARRYIDDRPLLPPPLSSVSLNLAQACNMSCGYCYADEGRFGGRSRLMCEGVARATVDRLIEESEAGTDLVLGFMGGEPLVNRSVLHAATRYAATAAREAGRRMRFSLTTNATLLTREDAQLFADFPFTVTVSIDGGRALHDAQRPMRDGSSSYDRVLAGLAMFEAGRRPRHLSARVTVTPRTGELLPILDNLVDLGFDEVGFAAVLVSANPALAFGADDFPPFLERMIACGEKALREISAGRRYPFGNFETAMHEIQRGSHRPYPCGAGAAYLSANAEGKLFACHRLIDDPEFAMGSVEEGSDRVARAAHLARSHVDTMEPCRSCWARYLCGGGCYHEVKLRGRIGCDYIRGWLDFCIAAYGELLDAQPTYFSLSEDRALYRISTSTTLEE